MTTRDEPPAAGAGWLRQTASILALPFVATVVVPALVLALAPARDTRWRLVTPLRRLPVLAGISLAALGLTLFVTTVGLFARIGRGTLAPWDPTRRLVVAGPYRRVRNPMISGVAAILLGEAVAWGSLWLSVWAVSFVAVNHIYFIAAEEPGLRRRFGSEYDEYRRNVPRWIPRGAPWRPERRSS